MQVQRQDQPAEGCADADRLARERTDRAQRVEPERFADMQAEMGTGSALGTGGEQPSRLLDRYGRLRVRHHVGRQAELRTDRVEGEAEVRHDARQGAERRRAQHALLQDGKAGEIIDHGSWPVSPSCAAVARFIAAVAQKDKSREGWADSLGFLGEDR